MDMHQGGLKMGRKKITKKKLDKILNNGNKKVYELDEQQKIKILGFMKKFFITVPSEDRISLNKTNIKNDEFNSMSRGSIMMITALTESSKVFIWEYCEKERKKTKFFMEKEYSNYFSSTYMFEIVKLLKGTSEKEEVKIESKTDSPIIISNQHFEIILAPKYS